MRNYAPLLLTRRRILSLTAAAAPVLFSLPVRGADDSAWNALRRGEAFAMIRHALAPGTGDPAHFDIDDCSTQRNLSAEGRRQAVNLGDLFRRNGIERAEMFSSAWCRCHETAVLMNLGDVRTLPALNSFFEARSREEEQMAALTAWLSGRQSADPIVLVTHQVNITALTDVFPGSGEIIFVAEKNGEFRVLDQVDTST